MTKLHKQNIVKLEEKRKCVYCGKPVETTEFLLNPGAHRELFMCSEKCDEKMRAFVQWDNKSRNKFYFVLFFILVINLMFLGFSVSGPISYVPMFGIGAIVSIWPFVFSRYERYEMLGLVKTCVIVRTAAVILAVASIFFMLVA